MKNVFQYERGNFRRWLSLTIYNPFENPEDKYNVISLNVGNHHLSIKIPQLFKPRESWVDLSNCTIASLNSFGGMKGYTKYTRKCFGFALTYDSIQLYYGIQPNEWINNDPKNSDHIKTFFWFWEWAFYSQKILKLNQTVLCDDDVHWFHFYCNKLDSFRFPSTLPEKIKEFGFKTPSPFFPPVDTEYSKTYNYKNQGEYNNYNDDVWISPREFMCITEYVDRFDNSKILTRYFIEERVWKRGNNKLMQLLLSIFPKTKRTERCLNITFFEEVGPKKGSYKGGVIGMAFEMLPNETHEQCYERFCKDYTFKG